ncbi:MAG: hypothetical protein KKA68_21180 [Gammaproteobacteria bacterium]|nr:hypothetical protein [Gammaproteobacteria bacterium]
MNGRIFYAFSPGKGMLEQVAEPAGPRPILVSAYYLQKKKKDGDILEGWYEYAKPYPLLLDSGVFTFRDKLGFGFKQGLHFHLMTDDDKGVVLGRGLTNQTEMDDFVDSYILYLKKNKGLYDYVVEMDVDEFMGVEVADIYYKKLCEAIPNEQIIRVWHSTRTFENWIEWCETPSISYLAIEGSSQHGRDPQFYRKFIDYARQHGKKTHVFALTAPTFLTRVDVDTVDSSSFAVGGRYALVYTPIGCVSFAKQTTKNNKKNYYHLTDDDRVAVDSWITSKGFTIEDIQDSWQSRNILNLFYFDDFVDVPYVAQMQSYDIFLDRFI